MTILIFAIIVLVVAGLVAWGVSRLPIPSPYNQLIQGLILIVAALVIANRAGIL